MPGCYGDSAIDKFLSNQADAHFEDTDQELIDHLEESYGDYLGCHPEHGHVFETACGQPVEDEDPDGKYYSMPERCETFVTKSGKVLVRVIGKKRSKRGPKMYRRVTKAFFTLSPKTTTD